MLKSQGYEDEMIQNMQNIEHSTWYIISAY